MKAIVIKEHGGPEKLQLDEIARPSPAEGEVLVKISAAGVNYIDTYHRTGLYPAEPPFTPGMEASGVVEETGPGVTGFVPGDRVAYGMCRGSYAEYAAVPAWQLVKIPAGVDDATAASAMLQGMTAHYLTHSTFPLVSGHTALVHAAAGGTGLLIVQMAKLRGARVIGTTSTKEKAARARAAGADEVILYTEQDFQAETRRLTDDAGVDVVYDSVGAATWEKSLDSLRPRGMMVTFGNASGPVPDFKPLTLSQKGSLFLTRPTLFHYCTNREKVLARATGILNWIASGRLGISIYKRYPLAAAAQADTDLEKRRSSGKLLLEI